MLGNDEIEIAKFYNYLGVVIQYNRFNSEAKDNMLAKGRKCVYSLIHKVINHNLDFKTAMHIFDHAAAPIILYGSELWNMPDISSKNMAMSSRKTMVAPYNVRTIETGGKEVVRNMQIANGYLQKNMRPME